MIYWLECFDFTCAKKSISIVPVFVSFFSTFCDIIWIRFFLLLWYHLHFPFATGKKCSFNMIFATLPWRWDNGKKSFDCLRDMSHMLLDTGNKIYDKCLSNWCFHKIHCRIFIQHSSCSQHKFLKQVRKLWQIFLPGNLGISIWKFSFIIRSLFCFLRVSLLQIDIFYVIRYLKQIYIHAQHLPKCRIWHFEWKIAFIDTEYFLG